MTNKIIGIQSDNLDKIKISTDTSIFLAHEAQTVVPEAITGDKDATFDDGSPKYQLIDQSKIVPLLTAALQEAFAEIAALTARVEALEAS